MPDAGLIIALQQSQLFAHPIERFVLIQTHISWVLLTGPYAYKLRKPVNLGFLDFTTLEQRFHDCCQELQLNRRFSPELYIGLIHIGGTLDRPRLTRVDPGQRFDPTALDYAVQMLQFPQQQLLSQRQSLPEQALLTLAQELAHIHASAPNAPTDATFGSPESIYAPMQQNFEQIRPYLHSPKQQTQLQRLQLLTESEFQQHTTLLEERHQQGAIRECHGDLHLGNIALHRGRACPFDCIEFNPRYRWIDPLSDLAFLLMDLQLRDHHALSNRILNRYLEQNLDYHALPLLRLYQAYRALVRAKITLLTSGCSTEPLAAPAAKQYQAYVDLADQILTPVKASLILMHGSSGSGKSWLSQQLVAQGHWIRLRSDQLRQHWDQHTPELPRYSQQMNDITYQRLLEEAESLLRAGLSIIIDAAFLNQAQRQPFLRLAQQLNIEPVIICCAATAAKQAHRITQRLRSGKDPSEATVAVLRSQQTLYEPLTPEERRHAVTLDTADSDQVKDCLAQFAPAFK
ncbi:MAG: AAA family ATPase [Motiliproteus sp.]